MIDLLYLQEQGGSDATGFGFCDPQVKSKFWVYKEDKPAREYLQLPATKRLLRKSPRFMIAHCRLATQGAVTDNHNNHPTYTKRGTVTIHNGVIRNDATLFTEHQLTRDGAVDSEIIGKMIDYHTSQKTRPTFREAIQKSLAEIEGTVASAIFSAHDPTRLYLIRRDNNLSIAYEKSTGNIYFATEKEALEEALYTYETAFGLFTTLNNADDILIEEVPLGFGIEINPSTMYSFKLDKPATTTYGGADNPWCSIHQAYFHSGVCKHTTKEEVKRDNETYWRDKFPQEKKTKSNAIKDKKKSKKEKSPSPLFDLTEPIKKPSLYSTKELNDRANYLLKVETGRTLTLKEKTEIDRILDMLEFRESTQDFKTDNETEKKVKDIDKILDNLHTRDSHSASN